ncbi:hypothetical protein Dimus_039798 [Dionaea muscipula]
MRDRSHSRNPSPDNRKNKGPTKGTHVIDMIAGGSSCGEITTNQRKRYARSEGVNSVSQKRSRKKSEGSSKDEKGLLAFTKADEDNISYLHQDAVVISAVIKNAEIRRILVDTGSSADVMYWGAYKRLQDASGFEDDDLKPIKTLLVGFSGDSVKAMREVTFVGCM